MGGVFDPILQLVAVCLLRFLVNMGRWVCEWRLLSERVGEKEINDDLMWHVFDLQMFYVTRVLHPDKNWRKLPKKIIHHCITTKRSKLALQTYKKPSKFQRKYAQTNWFAI